MMDKLIGSQAVIINLDVDANIFGKIDTISKSEWLNVIEINTADKNLLETIIKSYPNLKVGAGNIVNMEQLETCYQAGVRFITSPGFIPTLAQTANIYSINYLPGVATPSEALQAMHLGLMHLRPYPATLEFCKLLNDKLSGVKLYPAEVKFQDAHKYLNLESVAAISLVNPDLNILDMQKLECI